MKTTIEISDELLEQAKLHAIQTGRPLSALIEEGLCLMLAPPRQSAYRLPDNSVGDAERTDPLEQYSWPRLRSIIYGEYGPRSLL